MTSDLTFNVIRIPWIVRHSEIVGRKDGVDASRTRSVDRDRTDQFQTQFNEGTLIMDDPSTGKKTRANPAKSAKGASAAAARASALKAAEDAFAGKPGLVGDEEELDQWIAATLVR